MKTMVQTFETIKIRPDRLQFLIDNWLFLLLFIGASIYAGAENAGLESFAVMAAILLGVYLLLAYISLRRKVFIISSQTLVYDRGIFNRNADFIELYRVIDFQEKHSFLQQFFGLKTVIVYSGDRTTPQLYIPGLDVNSDIISELRTRVEFNKTRRGVYEITNRY